MLCVRGLFFNLAAVCFVRAASSDRAWLPLLPFGFPEKRSEVVFPSIIVNVLGGTGFPWAMYLACTCGLMCLKARGSIERGHACALIPCPAGSVEFGPRSHDHRSRLPVCRKECVWRGLRVAVRGSLEADRMGKLREAVIFSLGMQENSDVREEWDAWGATVRQGRHVRDSFGVAGGGDGG